MNGYIAPTDLDWYRFLVDQPNLEEVNFWQPGGGRPIRTVAPFAPFFFKLKAPHNAICGFGFLYDWKRLPAWFAWEAFGTRNGAATERQMLDRIARYRKGTRPGDPGLGSIEIGCLLVSAPVFFPKGQWILQPADWPAQAVQGKTYDLDHGEGRRVWEACRERAIQRIPELNVSSGRPEVVLQERARRLGQGTFRVAVTSAYDNACAVTREHSLPVIDAAHIRPHSEDGANEIPNGIALRTDLHRLFDSHYATVDEDHRFVVSSRLREDFQNGKTYYALQGTRLWIPREPAQRPDPIALEAHRSRFRG